VEDEKHAIKEKPEPEEKKAHTTRTKKTEEKAAEPEEKKTRTTKAKKAVEEAAEPEKEAK
jgi:hypothetical protein